MKKIIRVLTIFTLLLVVFFFYVSIFSSNKAIVVFSGVEGFPIETEIFSPPKFTCTIQTSNLTRNGDELDLKCWNNYFSFVRKRKMFTVSGLYANEASEFNQLHLQLINFNKNLANPDSVFVKTNKNIDDTSTFGTSYYLFYENGTNSSYYVFDYLLSKDGLYTQVRIQPDGAFTVYSEMKANDVVTNVNSDLFVDLYSKLIAFGYQRI